MNRVYTSLCQGLLILLAFLVSFLGYGMPAEAKAQKLVEPGIYQLASVKPKIALSEIAFSQFSIKNDLSPTQIAKKDQFQDKSSIEGADNFIYQRIFSDTPVFINSVNQETLIAWNWPFVSSLINRLRGKRSQRGAPSPKSTASLGPRGPCYKLNSKDPLRALVPPTKESKDTSPSGEFALGQTLAQSPHIWLYIPELPKGVNYAEVMLQDENDRDVLKQPARIPVASGLFSFNISDTGVSLEVDRVYHWFFSIICDELRPSRNPSVDAWVTRIPPNDDFLRQLETTVRDRERIELYLKQGIWYEPLELIAKLKSQYPQDTLLINQWSNLLQSVGIDEQTAKKIAQAPIAPRLSL